MTGSPRAAALARGLQVAVDALIAVVETVASDEWDAVPDPAVWSIGKEVAHVAEGLVRHLWIVRRTIGGATPARRPSIERQEMTTHLAPSQAIDLIRQHASEGAALIEGLSDDQLALETRPRRARGQSLGETIEQLLVGHVHGHREEIEAKLGRLHGAD